MLKFLVALFFTSAAAFAADEYKLQMDRPEKVGDRAFVTGTSQVKQVMEMKVDGQVVKNDSVEIDLEYEVERETLAITEIGKASCVRVKIAKIAGRYNGVPIAQLKAGDVIETKSANAGAAYLINGERATPEQKRVAQLLPKASTPGETKEDETFGPGRPIRAGDEWPINAVAATKQIEESGVPAIQPEGIKGKVKLLEVTNRVGHECLKVRGAIEISGSGMGVPNAPPELKVTELTATATMESDYPVDPNAVIPRSGSELKMRMAAAGDVTKDGRTVHLEVTSGTSQREQSDVKPIK